MVLRRNVGIVLAIHLLAGGCATRQQAKTALAAELSLALIGGVMVVATKDDPGSMDLPSAPTLIGGGLFIASGVALLGTLVGLALLPSAPASKSEPLPSGMSAGELTTRAMAAARAGDCATVVELGASVKRLDASYHRSVFVSDAAIARCLAPAPATPPRAP